MALYFASCYGHLEAVTALLATGADPWLENDIGFTPMDVVCDRAYGARKAHFKAITSALQAKLAWRRRSHAVVPVVAGME